MHTVKLVSLIFLAIYLIFVGLVDLMGIQLHWVGNLFLGLSALIAGILMILSIHECHVCHPEEETREIK